MPADLHSHNFKGVTTYVDGHLHLFSGVSDASPNIFSHAHIVAGRTTFDMSHSHSFSITTQGPTYVDTEHNKHYHYYSGYAYPALNHSHGISGTTFVLGE